MRNTLPTRRRALAAALIVGTQQQLGQFVNSEIDQWKRVVAQSKLEVQ